MIELSAAIPIIIWLHVLAAMAAVISEERSEKNDNQSPKVTRQQTRADSSKCTSHEIEHDDSDMFPVNLGLIDLERSQGESHKWDLNENVVLTPDEYVYRTLSSSGIRGCKDAWPIWTNPPFPWFVYQRTGEYATENETAFWYRADLYVNCNSAFVDRHAAFSAFEHAIEEVSSGCYNRNSEMLYYIDVWHCTYTFTYVQERVVQETRFYADNTHYMTIRQDIPPTYGTRTVK